MCRALFFVPDLYRGGIATVCESLLAGLSKYKNVDISVCVYDNQPIIREIPQSIKIYRINLPLWKNTGKNKLYRNLRGIIRYPMIIFGLVKLINIIKKEDPDIIISHCNIMNILSIVSKLLLNKTLNKKYKVIIVDHIYKTHAAERKYFGFLTYLEKILYTKADSVVAISNLIALYLKKRYSIDNNKMQIIHNPLNISKVIVEAHEEINDIYNIFNQQVIVTAGRLNKQKGQWHLIRCFKLIKQQIVNSKLVILGEGELRPYFVSLIKTLGLDKDVYLLGFQENPFKFIGRSSVFAFPSLYEGFPMTLIEAMACGVPVVSSDCKSGPREILAPDTDLTKQTSTPEFAQYGILMPVPDGTQYKAEDPLTEEEVIWAEVLINILKNHKLRNKYKIIGAQRVHVFDIDEISFKWINLIDKLNESIEGV